MVPPVSSQCRQDDATLQPGTSTRHQVVPGPLGWCHPSVYLSVCLQQGRPGSPNQCHPSVRSAVRMVPPFNPARQPGARMCQDGATRQIDQDGATRRFERVGSGDLWGHAPICEAKTECQSPNMVPPVSSSPVSSSPTAPTWCHPSVRIATNLVPPPNSEGKLVPPAGSSSADSAGKPECPKQSAQNSATRQFEGSMRILGATQLFVFQDGATRQFAPSVCPVSLPASVCRTFGATPQSGWTEVASSILASPPRIAPVRPL